MDPNTVVFEISSDEESEGDSRAASAAADEFDWISQLLDEDGKGKEENDDVILVGEIFSKPKQQKLKSLPMDLDDDCVVLEGNPDKPLDLDNSKVDYDSDELLVTGEKGQVACRDYPHPRHLCALYSFTSTPHESYCHQCHCYVCDSLAPCAQWGTGLSTIDHCHATDKEEYWRVQRSRLKKSHNTPPATPKVLDISLSMGLPQMNPVPSRSPMEANSVPQNHVFRLPSIRACSMSADYRVPNIINQSRNQRSAFVVPRKRFQSHLVSRQLHSTFNNVDPGDRMHNSGHIGPQSRAIFKRTGSVGPALTINRHEYSSSNNSYESYYSTNPLPVATPDVESHGRWQDSNGGVTLESNTNWTSPQQNVASTATNSVSSQAIISPQPILGCVFGNSLPSQAQLSPQLYAEGISISSVPSQHQVAPQPYVGNMVTNLSQPQILPQPNAGSVVANSAPCQPQVSSQPSAGIKVASVTPVQPQTFAQLTTSNIAADIVSSPAHLSSQPNTGIIVADVIPSQPQLSYQADAIVNLGSSQPQIPSLSNAGCTLSTSPSVPSTCSQPVSISHDSQNVLQKRNVTQSSMDFNFGWDSPASQSSQQPLKDNSQCVLPAGGPSLWSEFNLSSDPVPYFENWILENQHVSEALEVSTPSGSNVFSPEPVHVDASIFDF